MKRQGEIVFSDWLTNIVTSRAYYITFANYYTIHTTNLRFWQLYTTVSRNLYNETRAFFSLSLSRVDLYSIV